MTIKDVEKLTGLTAKSIRYYEDKGLLTVERNEENDYRTYSEKEVNRLKKIKLFRYLEFSVEEIKSLLDLDADETVEHLQERADHFLGESSHCEDKQKLCLNLAKDYQKETHNFDEVVSEYNEAIDFMESDEMIELQRKMAELTVPTLKHAIVATLIGLGPILWLFFNIYKNRTGMLMSNAVLAVLDAVLITCVWIVYFIRNRKKEQILKKKKNRQKEKTAEEKQAQEDAELKGKFLALLILLLSAATIVGLPFLVDKLFVPDDYLFFEMQSVLYNMFNLGSYIPRLAGCIVPIILLIIRMKKKKGDGSIPLFRGKAMNVSIIIAFLLYLIIMYCSVTSVCIVTEDAIICHTPLQPKGIEYKYEDVDKIITGFGEENTSLVSAKSYGEFYYEIEIDGNKIIFHQPEINKNITRYVDDTYLELEEFDQKLMSLGIEKEGNTNGSKNCLMESYYIERFCRIIQNQ